MYIPIWLIVIGAVIYFFWSRKNKQVLVSKNTNGKFVGRHQQFNNVKKFLGQDIPDLELQIAINKDSDERKELLEKLEEIEKYINSDLFTNRFDVESVNKDIRELTDEGYKNCVLKNDSEIEARCLKVLDQTIKYLQDFLKKNKGVNGDEVAKGLDKIIPLARLSGFMSYILLGGLLNESEQKAWIIMNSLLYSNKLVRDSISVFSQEPAQDHSIKLSDISHKLLNENKINTKELRIIEEEIKEGLLLSKENYK